SSVAVVGPGASSRALVPTGNIGSGWTGLGFGDSSWISGTTGVGFEKVIVSGFKSRMVDTNSGSFGNVTQATTVLDGITAGYNVASETSHTVADINYGDTGAIAGGRNWPVGSFSNSQAERTQFVVRV